MIPAIKPRHAIMREAALRGFSTATDLADYLVRKGLPFRDCHEIVGHAVKYGVESGKDLAEMSLEELRKFSDKIDRSEEHTSELQSLMRNSYAVFCMKKK